MRFLSPFIRSFDLFSIEKRFTLKSEAWHIEVKGLTQSRLVSLRMNDIEKRYVKGRFSDYMHPWLSSFTLLQVSYASTCLAYASRRASMSMKFRAGGDRRPRIVSTYFLHLSDDHPIFHWLPENATGKVPSEKYLDSPSRLHIGFQINIKLSFSYSHSHYIPSNQPSISTQLRRDQQWRNYGQQNKSSVFILAYNPVACAWLAPA